MGSLRKRRKSVCSFCSSNTELEVHHINQNNRDNRSKNLQTVCRCCHKKIHSHVTELLVDSLELAIKDGRLRFLQEWRGKNNLSKKKLQNLEVLDYKMHLLKRA